MRNVHMSMNMKQNPTAFIQKQMCICINLSLAYYLLISIYISMYVCLSVAVLHLSQATNFGMWGTSESSCALEDRRHNHKVRISERCFNWFHRRSHTFLLLHRPLHAVRQQCPIRLSVIFWQAPEAKKIKLNTFSTGSTVHCQNTNNVHMI